MNKKRIIIGTIVILALSFLFHSVYDKFPSFLTSILFPVNESIWEHNKMIIFSFLVWSILEYLFSKSGKSVLFLNLVAAILCILILDITFTPIYMYILKFQENLPLTIFIYAISIIISLILSKKFLFEKNKTLELVAVFGYLIIIIFLGYLTYHPIEVGIFYDYTKNIYGIPY